MWINRRRLETDLQRWRSEGWVSPAGYDAIAADIASYRRGVSLASALAILAAVLLGFAAISFVAANWDAMPRLARLALLFACIVASYLTAGLFERRRADGFADAAVVLASALFGVSIMLISQMYHLDGHPPDAVALWTAGAVVGGIVLDSRPTLAFAMALLLVWAVMESVERNTVPWLFLPAWAAVAAAFFWQGWSPGFHLSALALSLFAVAAGHLPPLDPGHAYIVLAAALAGVVAYAIGEMESAYQPRRYDALTYALATGFAASFAIQFIEDIGTGDLIVVAAVSLVVLLAAIAFGLKENHAGLIWVGYLGFAIEIFALYQKTLGTLLGTSLFFLIAGVLVAVLAAVAWRIAARDSGLERSLS